MTAMLDARLALVDRIRVVERRLAHAEQAHVALEVMRGQAHELGNAVQIVDLASGELVRRPLPPEVAELVRDLRTAAQQATASLAAMVARANPPRPTAAGAPVAAAVRAAVELADTVASRLAADEVEALVLAAILDAAAAPHVVLELRERAIDGVRWIELVRTDDRPGERALQLEPPALTAFVDELARTAGGEVSLAPGRAGHELAIALPVAT